MEQLRQVKVDAVRRTIVHLIQYCYHMPASIGCDRIGVSKTYKAIFVHDLSPWLLEQRSIWPRTFVNCSELWLSCIPSYHNCPRLDVVQRVHRYEALTASRLRLSISKEDLRVPLVDRTNAALKRLQLQAIRRGQILWGSWVEFTFVPSSVHFYIPAGLKISPISNFWYLVGVTQDC